MVVKPDELYHYGIKRRSGRYPWGSGENPYQRTQGFASYVKDMRAQGLSDTEIAKALEISTTSLRQRLSLAKEERRAADASMAVTLKDKGYSNVAIGERMGIPESSVRNLLKYSEQQKMNILRTTADVLKRSVDEKGAIDVGAGVELYMGISRQKLMTAVSMLEDEGYKKLYVPIEQLGTGKETNTLVLTKEDVSFYDLKRDPSKIKMVGEYTEDEGRTYERLEPPRSVDSKRIQVVYAEDGGTSKDGVIELRRGVEDISLGQARYAQVRIAVDGTHYLKGMAVYADDLPDGVDIRFNTNKHIGTPLKGPTGDSGVLKPMKSDPNNPFSSSIKGDDELLLAQRHYIDKDGKRQLSSINIVNEEGNWKTWASTLSSQFLSKQSLSLVKKQLGIALSEKKEEFDEIMRLTNPVVKKKLLDSFSDDADAAAVHLKAAGLPRQASHVILPINSLKESEIYAPNYRDGEKVVLVRYPHGGRFEIAELIVNNKNPEARRIMGNAPDAVGIHHTVAEKLSGADFDGDTVLVAPNNSGAVKTAPSLAGLKNFDPKAQYPHYEGMPRMTKKQKANEMGRVSNLITDMTIKGASLDEICRAVKHSMVVIDAEKHYLNYKQSEIDNGIQELREKYQTKTGGASTLISRASSQYRVNERKEGVLVTDPATGKTRRQYVNPETGEKLYTETGRRLVKKVVDKDGTVRYVEGNLATTETTKMAYYKDARVLSSGTAVEEAYASYANELKALANQARKETVTLKGMTVSSEAKKKYAPQVDSLTAQLNIALKNAPLERQAQAIAGAAVKARKAANPDMDADEIKKAKGQELIRARKVIGASKTQIKISDLEWEAIQSGAVSTTTLEKILNNTDLDKVKQLATPRESKTLTSAKASRARAMLARGYTQAEVADALGVSVSTIQSVI